MVTLSHCASLLRETVTFTISISSRNRKRMLITAHRKRNFHANRWQAKVCLLSRENREQARDCRVPKLQNQELKGTRYNQFVILS